MSDPASIQQSNVFGASTTSTPPAGVEPVSAETTAAGKLIDHMKWVADEAIKQAAARANWLGNAANAGQNQQPESLVQTTLLKPTALERSAVLSGFALPAITGSVAALPTLPEHLRIKVGDLRSEIDADVTDLQNSWMARFLPDSTDVDALDSLFTNILDGSASDAASARLDGLAADAVAALKATTDALMAALNTGAALVRTNLAANFADAQTGITSALDLAEDNTSNVAWARARDQAAREAARLEEEAASSWASRGFSLPGGALTAQAARARQASQSAASEIAAVQAEKQQQQFLEIARQTVESWLRRMEAQGNMEITEYREVAGAKLRAAELMLDADKFKAKQAFDHLGLTLDFTKFSGELATKYRLGVIGGMNDLIQAYASLRRDEANYLDTISKAEAAAQNAVLDYYRAALSMTEMGLRVDLQNTETDLRWATIAAQFIGTAVGNHVRAASTAAEVFSRTAGMALSGLNGIASVATSG